MLSFMVAEKEKEMSQAGNNEFKAGARWSDLHLARSP
jgi:hypothetical protein